MRAYFILAQFKERREKVTEQNISTTEFSSPKLGVRTSALEVVLIPLDVQQIHHSDNCYCISNAFG